tara:strand:- start:295 stop:570 length:276 start_codon:yes stop_codon:yes gene_type:complete
MKITELHQELLINDAAGFTDDERREGITVAINLDAERGLSFNTSPGCFLLGDLERELGELAESAQAWELIDNLSEPDRWTLIPTLGAEDTS